MAELNLPEEPGKTESTVVGDNIVFVTVDYDQDASNPLEDTDGVGTIYSFDRQSRTHHSEAIEEALKDPDRVLLSYFEHGLCKWDVASGSLQSTPDFEWDGTLHAGVWIPDNVIVEQANGDKMKGQERTDWMTKQAEAACELYTDFCNGAVYAYTIKAFPILHASDGEVLDLESDYRHSESVYHDSCAGYYGYENFDVNLKDAVESALSSLQAPAKEAATSI